MGMTRTWTARRSDTKTAVGTLLQSLIAGADRYRLVFIALLLLQFVAYSYFFTEMTFTDHTFPNTMLYGDYPTFKTSSEGRWLADLIILAQGGSGVQSVQMIGAAMLQALNGILFARLVGLQGKVYVFLLAGIVCLYPAFLDYYSFAADHISFVIGDTFVIIGSLVWVRSRHDFTRILGTSTFYFLALSTYAPKIALVSVFTLFNLVLMLKVHAVRREVLLTPAPLLLSAVLFWLVSKVVVTDPIVRSTHVNGVGETIGQITISYTKFFDYLASSVGGVPKGGLLGLIPLILVALGLIALLARSGRDQSVHLALFAAVLLVPVAVNGSNIVNILTPSDGGRFYAAYGYALFFFLGHALQPRALRWAALPLAWLLLWFFLVFGTQASNAAQLKTTYELNMINRILVRVEPLLGLPTKERTALVVIGRYPPFRFADFVRWPPTTDAPTMNREAFALFRQAEILNFFLGNKQFRQPTTDEQKSAILRAVSKDVKPWPSAGSVFLDGKTVVVSLQSYGPDVPVTWSTEDRRAVKKPRSGRVPDKSG
jgi:hypothetical protein